MSRVTQSSKKTLRISEVLSDHGSSLGSLLRRVSFLMQLEHLLANSLDPELASHFQLATIHDNRIVLIAPGAAWATRLRMQTPELLKALHQAGYAEIEHIDVRIAPLAVQPENIRRKRPLSPAAQQALDSMHRLGAKTEE
jgi:hypothetical protein